MEPFSGNLKITTFLQHRVTLGRSCRQVTSVPDVSDVSIDVSDVSIDVSDVSIDVPDNVTIDVSKEISGGRWVSSGTCNQIESTFSLFFLGACCLDVRTLTFCQLMGFPLNH